MKTYRSFLFVLFVLGLAAFAVGEYAELESYMNARAGYDFTKSAKNIRFQVPKGTVGKIIGQKQFHSGNYGFEMELLNGSKKGEKVFIYYTSKKPNMKLTKENPLEKTSAEKMTVEPEKAQFAKTLKTETVFRAPAEAKPVAKPAALKPAAKLTVDTGVDGKNLDALTEEAVKKGLEKLGQATAPKKCENCEVMMAGKESDQKCEEKSVTVGQMIISQSISEGQCEINVRPSLELKTLWPREYSIKSSGHFESFDKYGVRSYFFFPRKKEMNFMVSEDKKSITLQTASDVQIEISSETGKIVNVKPASKWQEFPPNDEDNQPKEKEHLALESVSGVIAMDLQYTMGGFPERKKSGSAILKSPEGKKCTIPNTLLFQYNMSDEVLGNVDFKFKTDKEFETFYKKHCKW